MTIYGSSGRENANYGAVEPSSLEDFQVNEAQNAGFLDSFRIAANRSPFHQAIVILLVMGLVGIIAMQNSGQKYSNTLPHWESRGASSDANKLKMMMISGSNNKFGCRLQLGTNGARETLYQTDLAVPEVMTAEGVNGISSILHSTNNTALIQKRAHDLVLPLLNKLKNSAAAAGKMQPLTQIENKVTDWASVAEKKKDAVFAGVHDALNEAGFLEQTKWEVSRSVNGTNSNVDWTSIINSFKPNMTSQQQQGGGGFDWKAIADAFKPNMTSPSQQQGGGGFDWKAIADAFKPNMTAPSQQQQGGGGFDWKAIADAFKPNMSAPSQQQGGGGFDWKAIADAFKPNMTSPSQQQQGGFDWKKIADAFQPNATSAQQQTGATTNTNNAAGGGFDWQKIADAFKPNMTTTTQASAQLQQQQKPSTSADSANDYWKSFGDSFKDFGKKMQAAQDAKDAENSESAKAGSAQSQKGKKSQTTTTTSSKKAVDSKKQKKL